MAARAHRLLTPAQKAHLRHLVEALERDTGAELAGVLIPHVDDVEGFATAYFNHLGIGKRGRDNGVLILVVVDRRLVRIEVGRGLETAIPDHAAKAIIDGVMAPAFRLGRYGEGLVRGAEEVDRLIRAAHPSDGAAPPGANAGTAGE